MKKVFLICLLFSLTSCNSQEKKSNNYINVSVEEFQQLITKKNSQLLDVRTPSEYKEGHIKKAKLINFFDKDFFEQVTKEFDKNQPIYLYCRSGGRSAKAARIFKSEGFKKVYNLLGGLNAWKGKNLKIEK